MDDAGQQGTAHETNQNNPCLFTVADLVGTAVALATMFLWVILSVYYPWTWHWVLHDLIGIAICVYVLSQVRLGAKIVTILFVGALVYDVFFVYVTRLFTSDGVSVMEKVASGLSGGASSGPATFSLK
jgi:hypothetical protein